MARPIPRLPRNSAARRRAWPRRRSRRTALRRDEGGSAGRRPAPAVVPAAGRQPQLQRQQPALGFPLIWRGGVGVQDTP
ncbi:hypothetical protein FEO87_02945 [Stenotrophomonas maltophilia]|nr:hypothetical protein FEO87_02945 [Stenotrophomonas maltophilia]